MDDNTVQAPRDVLEPITGRPARFLFEARDNRGLPGRFAYWAGDNGHVFLDPVPADLSRHYAGGYQSIPADEEELARAALGDAYRLETFRDLVPAGAFLEIGSWIGLTAYSALQAGYDVSVLERDARCVNLLNRSGIKAMQTDDPAHTLAQSRKFYDVIGMWHSIEHLPRPWEVIAEAAKSLNPGGVLVVAAPNPESAQFRVTGRHWVHLDAPRHIHLLPPSVIEEICRENGLAIAKKTTDDRLGEILDEYGWRWELHRRTGRIFALSSRPYRLLSRWMQRLHRSVGASDGAGYTLVFTRPVN